MITVAALVSWGLLVGPSATLAQQEVLEAGRGVLGADTVVLQESFDTEASWMDIGTFVDGENALRDGAFVSSVVPASGSSGGANTTTSYGLEAPAEVLLVEASIKLDRPGGAAGPTCESSLGLPRQLVAGVNRDGWWLGREIDGRLQVVDEGPWEGRTDPYKRAVRVSLECAVVPEEGGDRVTMSVDGRPVSEAHPKLEIPVGPYGAAGLLVGTDARLMQASYDDLVVSTGASYAPMTVETATDQPSE
jgi:hypothetical protein